MLETYADIEAKQEAGDYVRYEVLLRLLMAEMSLKLGFDASLQELDCISASIKDWNPFPDTVAALKALKRRYRLAVISNIDDKLFKKTAAHFDVAFDFVVTAEQVGAYKPSPVVFEHALRTFGVPRERILHVAQSLYHDVAPARALGLSTAWINRREGQPGFGATPPADASPDIEVPDLASLVIAAGL